MVDMALTAIGGILVGIGAIFAYILLRALIGIPNELSKRRTNQRKTMLKQTLIAGVLGYSFIVAVVGFDLISFDFQNGNLIYKFTDTYWYINHRLRISISEHSSPY